MKDQECETEQDEKEDLCKDRTSEVERDEVLDLINGVLELKGDSERELIKDRQQKDVKLIANEMNSQLKSRTMTIEIPKAASPLDGGTVDGANLGGESVESIAKMSFHDEVMSSEEQKDLSSTILDSILRHKQDEPDKTEK